jgi:hypothetical protein
MCSYPYSHLLSFSLFSETQKAEMISKFCEHEKYACIYYAYSTIHKYLVSCLYKLLGVGVQWICIIHDSLVLNTAYLHSSLLWRDRTLCLHHHNCCMLGHYVYIFYCRFLLCMCSSCVLCVRTNYIYILLDSCEYENSVFTDSYVFAVFIASMLQQIVLAFFMIFVLEHSVIVFFVTLSC